MNAYDMCVIPKREYRIPHVVGAQERERCISMVEQIDGLILTW